MSDDIQNQEKQQEITVESLQEQLQQKDTLLNDLQTQFEAMKSKTNELLDETKKAKNAKREAEIQAQKEAEEKARKSGDFEQLLKSSEQQRKELEDKLNNLNNSISQEKVNNTAMKLASELADGANAEILSEFIARRLKYTEDGLKVTDEAGNLTVSTLDQLNAEFANNERYASLRRGSQATGGGATGGGGSAPKQKIDYAEFQQLSQAQKREFIQGGGEIE